MMRNIDVILSNMHGAGEADEAGGAEQTNTLLIVAACLSGALCFMSLGCAFGLWLGTRSHLTRTLAPPQTEHTGAVSTRAIRRKSRADGPDELDSGSVDGAWDRSSSEPYIL